MPRLPSSVLFALGCLYSAPSWAQQISPLIFELAPVGSDSSQSINVANSGTTPIAFEISAFQRSYDEVGQIEEVESSHLFEIIPDAIWVEPGENRRVTVRWIGDQRMPMSQMHMIAFQQAPVRTSAEAQGTSITLRYEFLAIAHVVPKDARPDIAVSGWRATSDNLIIDIANDGNRYGRIDEGNLIVRDPAPCATITGEELSQTHGATWLLPATRRVIAMPMPATCNSSTLELTWRPQAATLEP